MRRLILFLSCFLLLAIRIQAASYTPESLPMVYLQDQTRHVVNPDGILSARMRGSYGFSALESGTE